MRAVAFCVYLLVAWPALPAGADEKLSAKDFKRLRRVELQKLEGTWEVPINTKSGWKGTLRVRIKLYDAKGKNADFGNALYDLDIRRGEEYTKVTNAPTGGIDFAGLSDGKKTWLVASQLYNRTIPAFEYRRDRMLSFRVEGDRMIWNVSASSKAFFTRGIEDLKLDWANLEWKRVKGK